MNVCIPKSLLEMPLEQLTASQLRLVAAKEYFKQPCLTGQFSMVGDKVTRIGDIPARPLFLALVDLLNQRRSRIKSSVEPTYADWQIASLSSRLPEHCMLLVKGYGTLDKLVFTLSGHIAVVVPSWAGVTVTVTGPGVKEVKDSLSDDLYRALVEQVIVD
jgi:hypothetical protein